MARMDDYGVDISAPASSDDGFSNASVVGGDNRNDEPSLSMGQSLGGGRFVGNQTAYNQATYNQNTRPSYSQDNLSLTQRNNLMQEMGITEDNPYGFQNRFSEVTGLDAKNLSYSNIMSPQQRQGIMQLTLDRYLDPMSQGQLRPGMRSGDITQYGIVQSVPKAEADMNMAEKLLSNNMLGNMLGIGQELRLGDLPAGSPAMIPASASVAGEDPRYTSSGAYKVETPEFLQNTMDSIASGIGSLRERFSPDPNLSVDIGAAGLQGASPAEAILVSDLSIGDLLKRGIDSTTDFLNIPNSDNFNPNNPSITPYLESPDLNGSGGNTMGVNFKFPFYG